MPRPLDPQTNFGKPLAGPPLPHEEALAQEFLARCVLDTADDAETVACIRRTATWDPAAAAAWLASLRHLLATPRPDSTLWLLVEAYAGRALPDAAAARTHLTTWTEMLAAALPPPQKDELHPRDPETPETK
jgi:hypothetical protein